MSNSTTVTNHGSSETVGSWRLDPERSSVEFRTLHFWGLVTITGRFDDYDGQLDLNTTPAIDLSIDAASIQTGNRKRDRHLRSADFFDVENHPRVRFLSDAVDLEGETLTVRGRLSARGSAIPLELSAEIHEVDGELEIDATTTAPHRELGMTYSPLRMIASHSELSVRGRLMPSAA
jgi:polyisoprenoid-binding protein YceI